MQTNITQNVSLYTEHVINIFFRKLFTALHLVNI